MKKFFVATITSTLFMIVHINAYSAAMVSVGPMPINIDVEETIFMEPALADITFDPIDSANKEIADTQYPATDFTVRTTGNSDVALKLITPAANETASTTWMNPLVATGQHSIGANELDRVYYQVKYTTCDDGINPVTTYNLSACTPAGSCLGDHEVRIPNSEVNSTICNPPLHGQLEVIRDPIYGPMPYQDEYSSTLQLEATEI